MPRLADIFMDHDGYAVDKWESYLGIYQSELGAYVERGEPVSLLEVGVQNGGSLQVWRKFLPPGSRIVGMDIDPACARLTLDENTVVHIADASDAGAIERALGDQTFDIVIDDGSHRSDHIIATFGALFARVRGGGRYIVEDLHASYWPEYGGGFRTAGSAMEFLKGLADGLNADHFRDTGMADRAAIDRLRDFGRSVARLTFYDSVAVAELMPTPRDATYRQVFGGGETRVVPLATLMFAGGRPPADTRLVGRTAARHVDQVLLGRVRELSEMADARRVDAARIDELTAALAQARLELAAARDSTSWRLTAPVRRLGTLLNRR